MDTKIVRTLDSLPSFFRGATPPADSFNDSLVMECLLIQLIGETRLLRLHRPYLSRGYKDRKFSSSKDRCVNSARSILVLLKTAEKAAPILLGTWLVLFYGFGAVSGHARLCAEALSQAADVRVCLGRSDLHRSLPWDCSWRQRSLRRKARADSRHDYPSTECTTHQRCSQKCHHSSRRSPR